MRAIKLLFLTDLKQQGNSSLNIVLGIKFEFHNKVKAQKQYDNKSNKKEQKYFTYNLFQIMSSRLSQQCAQGLHEFLKGSEFLTYVLSKYLLRHKDTNTVYSETCYNIYGFSQCSEFWVTSIRNEDTFHCKGLRHMTETNTFTYRLKECHRETLENVSIIWNSNIHGFLGWINNVQIIKVIHGYRGFILVKKVENNATQLKQGVQNEITNNVCRPCQKIPLSKVLKSFLVLANNNSDFPK